MSLIGRNFNNIVLVLDLACPESLNLIMESVRLYVSRGIPIRFGVVPKVGADTESSTMVASMTWYLVEMIGRSKTMARRGTFSSLEYPERRNADHSLSTSSRWGELKSPIEEVLHATYGRIAMQNMRPAGGPFEEVLEGPAAKSKVAQALAYTKRLGVVLPTTPSINFGALFLNGAYFIIDDDFTQNLQKTLSLHMHFLQQEVYLDSLNEKSDVSNYFYDLEICFIRRNAYIFPIPEKTPLKIVNLVDATRELEGLEEFHNSYIEADSVHLRLYLNPLRQLTELPIKRFYDYTFPLSLEFDAITGAEIEPSVLRSRPRQTARDMPAGQPPRGLQLELKSLSSANTASVDTLVMSNLGSFQLKANPRPWKRARAVDILRERRPIFDLRRGR
ncbi:hypothetical protein P7C70_g8069, partial [Phenoliferia sp. Uapishka_3]